VTLDARWWAFWTAVLGAPLVLLGLLLFLAPDWDRPFGTNDFHFYAVSGTTLAAVAACAVVIASMPSLRETRLVFLGVAFMAIAAIFAVHGLGTPGHIHDEVYAELRVSSWLSVMAGALLVTLSVLSLPAGLDERLRRLGPVVFAAAAAVLAVYVALSFLTPDWLAFLPFMDRNVQLAATAGTLALLGFSAWRYYQAFLFARLPSQWAMVCVLVLLMEVQLSMTFGRFWHYSWWLYHGLYALAFLILFAGWSIEVRRAGSVTVLAEALSMRDAMAQLSRGYTKPIADLVDAIEWKDLYTLGHVRRVATYAVIAGKEMGLSSLELRRLALGAQMHDVGKLGVPDRILTKPGPLEPDEFEIIKRHARRGYEIAMQVEALRPAADAIHLHHERYDGTGYPLGLAGTAIPLHARIVSVVDAFDAMTSGRVYQAPVSPAQAFEELRRCAGSHFDPAVVAAFERALARMEGAPCEAPAPGLPGRPAKASAA